MAVPIPGLSITTTKQQTTVNQAQALTFNPAINVISSSPSGVATSTPTAPVTTSQTQTPSQTSSNSLPLFDTGTLGAGLPVGDLYQQTPSGSSSGVQEAGFLGGNMFIYLAIGGAALLFLSMRQG